MRGRFCLSLAWLLVIALIASGQKPNLGPEWIKSKDEYGGEVYRKQVVVSAVHGMGNVAGYRLKLDHDELNITEVDGNQGFEVSSPYGRFEVRKDGRRATEITVVIGNYGYVDKNGDGIIDGMFDGIKHRQMIFFDGRYVEVEDLKTGLTGRTIRSPDHSVTYVFEDGKWVIK
jgi:hypothetical protein